jgi:hypothetical protein
MNVMNGKPKPPDEANFVRRFLIFQMAGHFIRGR